MIMAEVLYSSVSMYRNSRQAHMYCFSRRHHFRVCISGCSCSAYSNCEFKIKMNCALPKKSAGIRSSRVMPKNAATFELESVCEEDIMPIPEGTERVCENYPQKILPPWGDFSDQELEDQNHLDDRPRIPTKTVDKTDGEMYYLEERNEEILSKRILRLSRSNKVRSALALYRSMVFSNLLPDSHACNSLIACLLRNGRLVDALKVFDLMKSSEIITGHTYSLILKAVASVQSRDAALRILEEAERDERTKKYIDVVVYNTMIAIYGKVNDWVQAERVWRNLQENGHVGTAVTYRLLICTFVRCGQNELALDAYHEMIQNRLSPHYDAMQAIIGACTREGKWDMALNVFQRMLDSEIKPSLITCNALINSLGKAARVELAFEVYGLMKSLGHSPDAYTWKALIGALNRADRHADALCLIENIKKEHRKVLNSHIYDTCLMSFQKLGLWERAIEMLWEMEVSGFPISVASYNLVIGACEVARKPEVALQVYEHMVRQKQSPDVFIRLSLIRGCVWGSLWDEVEKILEVCLFLDINWIASFKESFSFLPFLG
ncbi:hypothetical protein OROHE_026489 [Orobanche hederae]